MLKNFVVFMINLVMAVLFILLFNFVFSKINLYIGLNPFSISAIACLGAPGIAALVLGAILL